MTKTHLPKPSENNDSPNTGTGQLNHGQDLRFAGAELGMFSDNQDSFWNAQRAPADTVDDKYQPIPENKSLVTIVPPVLTPETGPKTRDGYEKKTILGIIGWFLCLVIFFYMGTIPLDMRAQAILGGFFTILLFFMRHTKAIDYRRTFFLLTSLFLASRYFFWRVTTTLSYHDILSFIAAISLFGAELYSMMIQVMGSFVNISPFQREPTAWHEDDLPTVDIFIPSYNESVELLEITLLGALQIRYPKKKKRIYLCDDGGTLQKRNQDSREKSEEAWARRRELKKFCKKIGVIYHTRRKNEHAKAGNMNACLPHCKGDLVVIFDADHVPTADFLEKTVGLFQEDERLYLAQTPHFFINADPIQKNLNIFHSMPSENEMFYSVIQRGLDFWGSSFFCGSGAVFRRIALDEVGGFEGITITEDAETSIALHAKGWRSAYIGHPMLGGLQPDTFSDFIVQRSRWAQGMTQIFLLRNPVLLKGLTLPQRVCYLNNMLFWFFPFSRLTFLIAPACFLIFGMKIYDANLLNFSCYVVPYIFGSFMTSNLLFGKVRWLFISELYEVLQSLFSLKAILKVIANPHAPTFLVTPKGVSQDEDEITPMAAPLYWLFVFVLFTNMAGVFRYIMYPEQRGMVIITLVWSLFNLMIMMAAFGALFEKKQRRTNPRMESNDEAVLITGDEKIPCVVKDISYGGAKIVTTGEVHYQHRHNRAILSVFDTAHKVTRDITVNLLDPNELSGAHYTRLQFRTQDEGTTAHVVGLMFGDSTRWTRFLGSRERRINIFQSLYFIFSLGLKYAWLHVVFILKLLKRFLWTNIKNFLVAKPTPQQDVALNA